MRLGQPLYFEHRCIWKENTLSESANKSVEGTRRTPVALTGKTLGAPLTSTVLFEKMKWNSRRNRDSTWHSSTATPKSMDSPRLKVTCRSISAWHILLFTRWSWRWKRTVSSAVFPDKPDQSIYSFRRKIFHNLTEQEKQNKSLKWDWAYWAAFGFKWSILY